MSSLRFMMKGLLVLILVFSYPLYSSTERLSLKDFIQQAKKNDPDYENIISEQLRANFNVNLNVETRALVLDVSNEYGFAGQGQGTTSELSAGLEKSFLETGTSFGLTYSTNELADREEQIWRFQVEQSLYNNAFGSQTRQRIQAYQEESSILKLQVIESYEEYMARLKNLYFEYVLADLQLERMKELKSQAQDLLDIVKKRRESNIATQTDLKRARLDFLLAQENEMEALEVLETARFNIKRVMGENQLSRPVGLDELGGEELPAKESLDLTATRTYRIARSQESVAKQMLEDEKKSQRPRANLVLGYNFDDSQRFRSRVSRKEGVVGVNISYNFGDTQKGAQIQQASLELKQAILNSKSQSKDLENAYEKLYANLKNLKERLDLDQRKKELSQSILREDEERYKRGRLELNELIERRRDVTSYVFDYFESLVSFHQTKIEWLRVTDQLVDQIN